MPRDTHHPLSELKQTRDTHSGDLKHTEVSNSDFTGKYFTYLGQRKTKDRSGNTTRVAFNSIWWRDTRMSTLEHLDKWRNWDREKRIGKETKTSEKPKSLSSDPHCLVSRHSRRYPGDVLSGKDREGSLGLRGQKLVRSPEPTYTSRFRDTGGMCRDPVQCWDGARAAGG